MGGGGGGGGGDLGLYWTESGATPLHKLLFLGRRGVRLSRRGNALALYRKKDCKVCHW